MLRCCKLSRLSVLDLDSGSDELTRMKSWQSWHSSWHPATVMNSVSSGNKIQIFHNFQFSRMTIFFLFRRWGWTPCPSPLSWPCRWSWCWRARSSASASLRDCCSRIWCSETSAASVGDPRPKHKKIRYRITNKHILQVYNGPYKYRAVPGLESVSCPHSQSDHCQLVVRWNLGPLPRPVWESSQRPGDKGTHMRHPDQPNMVTATGEWGGINLL